MSLLIASDYVGEGLPAKHAVVATGALQLTDRRQTRSNSVPSGLPVTRPQFEGKRERSFPLGASGKFRGIPIYV